MPMVIDTHDGGSKLEQLQVVLYRYCLSLTKSPADAEDLAQSAWLKVLSRAGGANHPNLEALLLRIARHSWIDETRRRNVWTRIARKSVTPAEPPADSTPSELELHLHVLASHMSPLQRTVFLLRDVFDHPIAETAKLLATSEGAVKAALHRARQSLSAIRDELELGETPVPADDSHLSAMAAALRREDTEALIRLSRDVSHPAAADSTGPVAMASMQSRRRIVLAPVSLPARPAITMAA